MSSKRDIKAFEQTLIGAMGGISSYAEGMSDFLFDYGFPRYREEMERVRPGLEMLRMYEQVRSALDRAEQLARDKQYEEAGDTLSLAVKALMKASGTWEDMKPQYTAANQAKLKA